MHFKKILLIFCLLIGTAGLQKIIAQDSTNVKLVKESIHFHFLDLFRTSSPALKISYQKDYLSNNVFVLEASIISDFNARIAKIKYNERGILGGSLGIILHRNLTPNHSSADLLFGFRLNYSHKRRKIEDWVSRKQGLYSQLMNYTQVNNNIGIYMRTAIISASFDELKLSIAINTGYLVLFVDNTLPSDVSLSQDTDFIFGTSNVINQKNKGIYNYPHVYIEFNIGYTLK
jgi:hypothetical protein